MDHSVCAGTKRRPSALSNVHSHSASRVLAALTATREKCVGERNSNRTSDALCTDAAGHEQVTAHSVCGGAGRAPGTAVVGGPTEGVSDRESRKRCPLAVE